MKILVVGAGFAGATVARELAEAGHKVVVVDKRDHVGGNAYDYVNEHGIRVHKYGPHLWHTSNDEVQEWVSRFTEWVPYKHWVRAQLADGSTTPLPINRETIEDLFYDRLDTFADKHDLIEYDENGEMVGFKKGAHAAFLESLVEHHPEVTNSRQHVENSVGKELCDIFFAPYTKKMWGLALEELPASVAARIPTNVESGSDLYFPKDKHQCLPADGYTAIFNRIFDHPNIKVELNTVHFEGAIYRNGANRLDDGFDHIFTSEPIDEFFGFDLGVLPWRSVKMHVVSMPLPQALDAPVINFTHTGPHTRVTEWKQLPAHGGNDFWTTLTFEEPCDYRANNMERYYPVKTSLAVDPNRELYKQYRALADEQPNVTFIGRCGQYVYTDMAPCISSSLAAVRKFLKEQP